jgi:hypothetical protein
VVAAVPETTTVQRLERTTRHTVLESAMTTSVRIINEGPGDVLVERFAEPECRVALDTGTVLKPNSVTPPYGNVYVHSTGFVRVSEVPTNAA